MAKYTKVCKFRLTPEEEEQLAKQAAERGVSKADLIRSALGWEPASYASLPPSEATVALLDGVGPETSDPDEKPGNAALERLAARTRERLNA